jgi:hypothetical protein
MPLCTRIAILFLPIALLGGTVSSTEIIDPEMPYVHFISPRDGATLGVPSSVASDHGRYPRRGQFSEYRPPPSSNRRPPALDYERPIPQDKQHLHFGAGERRHFIELPRANICAARVRQHMQKGVP